MTKPRTAAAASSATTAAPISHRATRTPGRAGRADDDAASNDGTNDASNDGAVDAAVTNDGAGTDDRGGTDGTADLGARAGELDSGSDDPVRWIGRAGNGSRGGGGMCGRSARGAGGELSGAIRAGRCRGGPACRGRPLGRPGAAARGVAAGPGAADDRPGVGRSSRSAS